MASISAGSYAGGRRLGRSSALAIGLLELGPATAVFGAVALLSCGLALIVALETIWAGAALRAPGLQAAAQDRSAA